MIVHFNGTPTSRLRQQQLNEFAPTHAFIEIQVTYAFRLWPKMLQINHTKMFPE
jgi:hypothetical protein